MRSTASHFRTAPSVRGAEEKTNHASKKKEKKNLGIGDATIAVAQHTSNPRFSFEKNWKKKPRWLTSRTMAHLT